MGNGWKRFVARVTPVFSAVTAACSADEVGPCEIPDPNCDVRQGACQRAIYRATACMRDQEGSTMPHVRVVGMDELEAEIRATYEDEPPDRVWGPALAQLRLLDPATTLEEASIDRFVENVAAYYVDDSVTVVDRGRPTRGANALFILSHEFAHALQDDAVDIYAFRDGIATSSDGRMSATTLIEGEANILSMAVYAETAGLDRSEYHWSRVVSTLYESLFESVLASTSPYLVAEQSVPYALGTGELYGRWLSGGQPAFDALYETPRLTVSDWLGAGEPPAATEPLDCHPTEPPPGFVGADFDRLGAVGVFALGSALGMNPATSWDRAAFVRNDAIVAFRRDGDPAAPVEAVAWRIRWASEWDAGVFLGVLDVPPGIRVVQSGAEATLWAAADPAVFATWDPSRSCGAEVDLPMPPTESQPSAALAGPWPAARILRLP